MVRSTAPLSAPHSSSTVRCLPPPPPPPPSPPPLGASLRTTATKRPDGDPLTISVPGSSGTGGDAVHDPVLASTTYVCSDPRDLLSATSRCDRRSVTRSSVDARGCTHPPVTAGPAASTSALKLRASASGGGMLRSVCVADGRSANHVAAQLEPTGRGGCSPPEISQACVDCLCFVKWMGNSTCGMRGARTGGGPPAARVTGGSTRPAPPRGGESGPSARSRVMAAERHATEHAQQPHGSGLRQSSTAGRANAARVVQDDSSSRGRGGGRHGGRGGHNRRPRSPRSQ